MSFAEDFYRYGKAIFIEFPEIEHDWTLSDGNCELFVPAFSASGFDIRFVFERDTVTVIWGIWHSHMDLDESGGDTKTRIENLFGLLRDMLSPNMRIRELYAGSRPYRGFLETFDGKVWAVEEENGLLFWNYFGKRSVRTYSNSVLQGRLSKGDSR